jgi:predicted transposase YdaD
MFISQKHRNHPAHLFEKLSNILESLQTKEERNSFETIIVYVLTVFEKQIGIIDILKENINKPINKLFMTLYDEIELKGKIEGKIEGELKNQRQTVINGFKNGLEIKMISNITQLAEEEVIKILKEEGLMK